MKLQLYSIYDQITQTYNQPFSAILEKEAIRMLSTAVKDPSTNLHQHHSDFQLYHVAEYDDQTGTFANVSPHVLVIKATQIYNAIFSLPTSPEEIK